MPRGHLRQLRRALALSLENTIVRGRDVRFCEAGIRSIPAIRDRDDPKELAIQAALSPQMGWHHGAAAWFG